jgi:hypothetical protein
MCEKRSIEIPEDLARIVEAHREELGAESLQAFVIGTLTDHLRRLGWLSAFSEEEEAEVERRLRDLGYVD